MKPKRREPNFVVLVLTSPVGFLSSLLAKAMGFHQSSPCFSSLLQWCKVYQPPFLFPDNVSLVLLPSATPSGSDNPLLATSADSH